MGKMKSRGNRSLTQSHITPFLLDRMASSYKADTGSGGLGWYLGFCISSQLLGIVAGPGTTL